MAQIAPTMDGYGPGINIRRIFEGLRKRLAGSKETAKRNVENATAEIAQLTNTQVRDRATKALARIGAANTSGWTDKQLEGLRYAKEELQNMYALVATKPGQGMTNTYDIIDLHDFEERVDKLLGKPNQPTATLPTPTPAAEATGAGQAEEYNLDPLIAAEFAEQPEILQMIEEFDTENTAWLAEFPPAVQKVVEEYNQVVSKLDKSIGRYKGKIEKALGYLVDNDKKSDPLYPTATSALARCDRIMKILALAKTDLRKILEDVKSGEADSLNPPTLITRLGAIFERFNELQAAVKGDIGRYTQIEADRQLAIVAGEEPKRLRTDAENTLFLAKIWPDDIDREMEELNANLSGPTVTEALGGVEYKLYQKAPVAGQDKTIWQVRAIAPYMRSYQPAA